MTGDSGNVQTTEVATAYEQWIADDVARFLAGDDPFAEEEEDSDLDELPAPVDMPAPPPVTAPGPPPAPAPSMPAELSTPALHSECTIGDGLGPGYLPEAGQNQSEREGRATAYQPRMEQDVPAVAQHRVLEALSVFHAAPANELMVTMPESISNPPETTDSGNQYTACTEIYQSAHAPGKVSRCTSPATFPSVHSTLQPAAHSHPSLLHNGRDAVPVGHVATMSLSEQDPVIQATKAAIFAAVPARMQLAALGGTSRVASASAPVPRCMSKALPTHHIAAARESHMGAAGSQPPLRQHALAPGPVSVPSNLAVKQSTSGGCSTSDMLLTQFLPNNRCHPFERGEMLSMFLRSWPLPCEGEDLRKVQDTIYSVIMQLYADGRVPSTQNVEQALLSKNCAITRSKSVLQIVAHQPTIYAIWSSAKFHTYIMLRERPMFPKAINMARQILRARAESSDLETAVKAARRYSGVRSHMIELSSPAPTHASLQSQVMEPSPPAQTNQVESQILAVLAAAAASSSQVGVERSSGTYATWDAYCPKCFEIKWQMPNYGSAVCRGCNVRLLELPTHEEEGYAGEVNEDYDEQDVQRWENLDCALYEGADYPQEDEDDVTESMATMHYGTAHGDVDVDADMPEISGQDRKKSNGIGNSERIASIIREHGYTTLMIRNLSMRMRQKHLLKEIDTSGFQDRYDYCHLPVTFGKGSRTSGVGYAFVNFEVVEDAAQFVMKWHGQRRMGVSRSDIAITISHAEMQGKEANAVNWLRRGCHIRNPGLRPFIKGRCEALEEHERKKAMGKLDASAPPSLPPGLVLNPSSAEMTIGNCDTDVVNSLPPGLVQHVPVTSPAPPGLVASFGRSSLPGSASAVGVDAEIAGLEISRSCRGH